MRLSSQKKSDEIKFTKKCIQRHTCEGHKNKLRRGYKTAIITRCFNEKYCRKSSFYFEFPCFEIANWRFT